MRYHPPVPGGAPAERPDFEVLLRRDTRSLRRYLILTLTTASIGIVAAVVGWMGDVDGTVHGLVGKLLGLAVGATSAVPAKECLDRFERIDGIRILAGRWQTLTVANDVDGSELARVQELYRKLYERAVMGAAR